MINDDAEAHRFSQSLLNEMNIRLQGSDPDLALYLEIHQTVLNIETEFNNLTPGTIKVTVEAAMEDFCEFMIDTKTRKSPKNINDAKKKYPLGFWNAQGTQVYRGIGLEGISETHLLEGLGTTFHLYDDIPDPIHWQLAYFDQGPVRCFIGSAEVREVDAICNVPSMPHMQSEILAEWVRKSQKGRNEWQRQLSAPRVHSIQKFADTSADNHILTPILLYCEADTPSVKIDWNTGDIRINLSVFLNPTGAGFSDRKGKKDLRPLWLVDGQHRTRGMATSVRGSKMRVPIILLAGGDHPFAMDREAAAKLFTEINTYSEEIGFELKHFLSHRFKLPGPGSFDYESLNTGSSATLPRRRANTYAYRLAAYISEVHSTDPLGPGSLERGVAISPSDSKGVNKIRIGLKKALSEIRPWFRNDEVYGRDSAMNKYTDARDEVTAFFRALDVVVGANWQPLRGSPKSVLERPNVVRYMLSGYPRIRKVSRGRKRLTTVLNQDDFEKALAPLAAVNWMDTDLRTHTGEWPSKWFADWVIRAIEHGKTYSRREARSTDPALGILPGKGIKAPPGDTLVEVIGAWTSIAGTNMSLRVSPATNAYLTDKIENFSVRVNNNEAKHTSKISKADRTYTVTVVCDQVPMHIDVVGSVKNPNMLESRFSERLVRP